MYVYLYINNINEVMSIVVIMTPPKCHRLPKENSRATDIRHSFPSFVKKVKGNSPKKLLLLTLAASQNVKVS